LGRCGSEWVVVEEKISKCGGEGGLWIQVVRYMCRFASHPFASRHVLFDAGFGFSRVWLVTGVCVWLRMMWLVRVEKS
jgi:hypothetical protein